MKYTNEFTDAVTKTPESNKRSPEPATGSLETGAPDATEKPQPHAEGLDTALCDVMHDDNILDRKEVLDA